MANQLEELARKLRNVEPKADTYALKLFVHSRPVHNPAYGDAVVDRRYLGKSIVIHIGVLPADAMDTMLMAHTQDVGETK